MVVAVAVAVGVGVGYHIPWTDSTVALIDTAFVFSGVIRRGHPPWGETLIFFPPPPPMCTRTRKSRNKVRVEFRGLGQRITVCYLLTPGYAFFGVFSYTNGVVLIRTEL